MKEIGPGWYWAPDPSKALVGGSTSAGQRRSGEMHVHDKAEISGLIRLEKEETGLNQLDARDSLTTPPFLFVFLL